MRRKHLLRPLHRWIPGPRPMVVLILAAVWVVVVVAMLARAISQAASYESLGGESIESSTTEDVTIVIPARNEAKNIGSCLEGILHQTYPNSRVQVIVVDDQSTDATAEVAQRFAEESGRVRVERVACLPGGWTGKCHACQRGAAISDSHWLCFLDADTTPGPEVIRGAVTTAERRGLDLLSLEPSQELGTFWERLIVPCGMLAMAFLHNLRRVNEPHSPFVAANGQFLLFRRKAYNAIGGHAAVANAICEDTALARRIKQSGQRFALLGGEAWLRVRMYKSFRSLWEGFSKNAVLAVGGRWHAVVLAVCGTVIALAAILLPLVTALQLVNEPLGGLTLWPLALSGAASAAWFATHVATARHFHVPGWYGLLFPFAYLLGAALLLNSVWWWTRGSVRWKNRTYESFPSTPAAPTGRDD